MNVCRNTIGLPIKRAAHSRSVLMAFFALAMLLPMVAEAGLFSISPIRLDLDRQNKTDSITVRNDDAEKKLDLQARLYEWTQDADGKDIYVESADLVFFPRIFTVEKQDERVIRVGLKVPAAATEKAFRLFIEELPPPPDAQRKGAQVAFVLRFGIPIFLRPETEQISGSIERVDATPGGAAVIVRNTGNRNFQIQSLNVKSGSLFEKDIVGGYVLAGSSKKLAVEIPPDICRKLDKLQIVLKSDGIGTIERTVDWDASHCGSK